MTTTNFTVEPTNAEVLPFSGRCAQLRFDAEASDVLANVPIREVIEFYGVSNLLDEIGIDAAADNWMRLHIVD